MTQGAAPTVGARPTRTCPKPCAWTTIPIPTVAVDVSVTGMVAPSRDDLWLATLAGPGWSRPQPAPDLSWAQASPHPVLLHLTAAGWKPQTRLPHSSITDLTASGPSDIWGLAADQGNRLVHYDGKHWRFVTPPPAGNPSLEAITAIASNNIWVVGAGFTATTSYALAEHWDGKRWHRSAMPTVSRTTQLTAVAAAAPNDIWAFGHYATAPPGQSGVYTASGLVTEHWDGNRWHLVRQPTYRNSKASFQINAAEMISRSDGWAVGSQIHRNGGGAQQLVLHWDGQQWQPVDTPFCCAQTSLNSLSAANPDAIWTAGFAATTTYATTSRVDRWDGNQWQRVPSPNLGQTTLTTIIARPDGTAIVAGTGQNPNQTSYPVLEIKRP